MSSPSSLYGKESYPSKLDVQPEPQSTLQKPDKGHHAKEHNYRDTGFVASIQPAMRPHHCDWCHKDREKNEQDEELYGSGREESHSRRNQSAHWCPRISHKCSCGDVTARRQVGVPPHPIPVAPLPLQHACAAHSKPQSIAQSHGKNCSNDEREYRRRGLQFFDLHAEGSGDECQGNEDES